MSQLLINQEYESLHWSGPLQYPDMVRIRTPTDGSCFFHALAKAYCRAYIVGAINGVAISRTEFIQKFRQDLATMLAQPVYPEQADSPTHYDQLSRGKLADFAKDIPHYSLDSLVEELIQGTAVDFVYNEFISDQLNKDIYLLDLNKQDVYIVGNDLDLYYKGRDSIVVLYLEASQHYELIGLQQNGVVTTIFDPTHAFISTIRSRLTTILR